MNTTIWPYKVLFLCTGNSARSIIAETILRNKDNEMFQAYSAGRDPVGAINPNVDRFLQGIGMPTDGLRSKGITEFFKPTPINMDFIFTVCDKANKEPCPIWPGQPITAHWSIPDPALFTGTSEEIATQIADVYRMLETRITLFMSLPLKSIDSMALQKRFDHMKKEISSGREHPI